MYNETGGLVNITVRAEDSAVATRGNHMNIFIIIQASAALIAAGRGWGFTPISMFALLVYGSLNQWWSIDTAVILDYISIIVFIFMAAVPPNKDEQKDKDTEG